MKTFILGLFCGLVIAGSTVAFASDSIQALLFPAHFEINGSSVDMGKDYQVLNVDGHAYVPVRFVAENLEANIDYDADSQKIVIRNKPLDITDPDYKTISVGNLILTKDGDHTKVTGQLRMEGFGNPQNMVGAGLTFYDDNNVMLGDAVINGTNFGSETQTFVTEGKGDLRNYATVYLHVGAVTYHIISDVPHVVYTNSNCHFSMSIPSSWEGKYEVKEQIDEDSHNVNVHFIDKANMAYGGVLFTISLWSHEDWQNNGPIAKSLTKLYKVGEDADHVYIQFPPGDVEYNPHDANLTAEYKEMSDQVSKIRTSFKLVK